MMMKRQPKDSDYLLAREAVRRFSGMGLSGVEAQRNLIKMYYPNGIRGIPIGEIGEDQAFMVAKRLYDKASDVVDSRKGSVDDVILSAIGAMQGVADYNKWQELNESVCIKLEGCNIPETSYLVREYERAKAGK